jgi:hypothetical protein
MTLEEAREGIGRKVIYEVTPWDGGYPALDEGVITSVNDHYVFVRYGSDTHSKATYPGDLRWMAS